jgi:membrane protease YdiL (CAAX protease family)
VKKRIWKESAAFLAATFGVTWLFWFGAYFNDAPASARLIMLGTAAPSVMGIFFTVGFGGKPELQALFRSALHYKAPRIGWVYATLLFPVVLLCACAVFAVTGGILPSAQFPLWFLPLAFFYIFICMGPLGEELGWRGFLLKRFLPEWGVIKSGLIVGLIWSAWHLPLFLMPDGIQNELAKMGLGIAVSGYFLYTTCISLLMSVLYDRTDGNLLLCMIFHTVCNLSLGVAPLILIESGGAILLMILLFTTVFILRKTVGKRLQSESF